MSRTASMRIEREARKLRVGVSRAIRIGAPAFFLFLGLDLYIRATLYPEADLGRVIAWRTAGALALGSALLILRRELDMRRVVWLTAAVLSLTLVTLGGLAVELGGLESSYIFSIAYFAVAIGTFLPANWRGMSALIGLPSISFLATILIGVATSHHRSQLDDPRSLHTFAAHVTLMLGLVVFAVFSGQVHWRARRALEDARRLGRYRLKRLIGEGGMNEVWLARDETLDRDIALKILRPDERSDDPPDTTRVRRFEREALATSALTSPHTVRVFDHGLTEDGVSWIAMEYLRGLDLDRLVHDHGPLDPRRAIHFVRQAALSLAEAHELGLVHRDIKPANLFALSGGGEEYVPIRGRQPLGTETRMGTSVVSRGTAPASAGASGPSSGGPPAPAPALRGPSLPFQSDFLKVVDFGIARPLDPNATSLTLFGMIVGTPAFMAPELFLGQNADPRADVYSLGATMYLLLTGEPPLAFSELNHLIDLERRKAIVPPTRRGPHALPMNAADALDALVMRCLAADPNDRPVSGKAVLAELDALPLPAWTDVEARAWWANVVTLDDADPRGTAPTL